MRIKSRRFVLTAALSLLVVSCIIIASVSLAAGGLHGASAAPAVPTHYFAPYWEDGEGDSLQAVEQATGQKYFTLAFVISNGGCQASSLTSLSEIQALRNVGGDVIQSFGGADGQELAQACDSVSSLQAQYQSVISQLSLTHVDFDVEGGEESDATTYTRRDAALAGLQKANPNLVISFTLPSSQTGLDSGTIGMLKDAISQGVNIGVVNLMVMDYDDSGQSYPMGQDAISAANGLYSQLQALYPQKSSAEIWAMVGLTPMIGKNDAKNEIFTLDDANQVLAFAQQNHLGELSFWVVSRDNAGCPDYDWSSGTSDTCSGISQSQYAFTKDWQPYSDSSPSSVAVLDNICAPTPSNTGTYQPLDTGTPTEDASTPTEDASTPTEDASTPTEDASTPTEDASTPTGDASTPTGDASTPTATNNCTATPTEDASTPTEDASTPTEDASTPTVDASTPTEDASTPTVDASTPTATNGCTATPLDTGTPTADASTPIVASTPSITATESATPPTPTACTGFTGSFYILNQNSGKVLDDTNWNTHNGAVIQQWKRQEGQTNQQWTFHLSGADTYSIINKHSGKALEDPSGSTKNGTHIRQTKLNAQQANQLWYIEPGKDANTYYIVNKQSKKVLDDTNWNTGDGTLIQQWTKMNGQANQEWTLEAAS